MNTELDSHNLGIRDLERFIRCEDREPDPRSDCHIRAEAIVLHNGVVFGRVHDTIARQSLLLTPQTLRWRRKKVVLRKRHLAEPSVSSRLIATGKYPYPNSGNDRGTA